MLYSKYALYQFLIEFFLKVRGFPGNVAISALIHIFERYCVMTNVDDVARHLLIPSVV